MIVYISIYTIHDTRRIRVSCTELWFTASIPYYTVWSVCTFLVTKRKHVEREVLSISDSILPDAQRGLEVVRVWASRGNNLHEVERNDGTRCLVSMPSKFRKRIWIKRGTSLIHVTLLILHRFPVLTCILEMSELVLYRLHLCSIHVLSSSEYEFYNAFCLQATICSCVRLRKAIECRRRWWRCCLRTSAHTSAALSSGLPRSTSATRAQPPGHLDDEGRNWRTHASRCLPTCCRHPTQTPIPTQTPTPIPRGTWTRTPMTRRARIVAGAKTELQPTAGQFISADICPLWQITKHFIRS